MMSTNEQKLMPNNRTKLGQAVVQCFFCFFLKKIIPRYSTYIKGILTNGVNQHDHAWQLDY